LPGSLRSADVIKRARRGRSPLRRAPTGAPTNLLDDEQVGQELLVGVCRFLSNPTARARGVCKEIDVIVVGMHEAKTQLSKLVKRAAAGEEIVVANAGKPVAKIVAYTPPRTVRKLGMLAGQITIKPGFDYLPPGFREAFSG